MSLEADIDAELSAIRLVMRQELSLVWGHDEDADRDAFAGTFIPDAVLFPVARSVRERTLGHVIERMKQPRTENARIFQDYAARVRDAPVRQRGGRIRRMRVARKRATVNREMNATAFVREAGALAYCCPSVGR